MKKIYSCLLILSLLTSCNSDNDHLTFNKKDSASHTGNEFHHVMRQGNELPINSRNNYDAVGICYNEILDSYYEIATSTTVVPEILEEVEILGASNSNFQAIKSSHFQPGLAAPVQQIINNPMIKVPVVISTSGMSTTAKVSFTTFLQRLNARCKSNVAYDSIYDFIVQYEDEVIGSTVLTDRDKEILLTSSAISRFSAYRRKRKPKKNTDQDWDWMIASIASGTDGVARFSTGNAITMSAVATIKFD